MAISGTSRRIRLPDDLSGSLKHLDDTELRKLSDAVRDEIERRNQLMGSRKLNRPGSSSKEPVELPEGQANAIRASFKAGVTPAAIARTLGLSLSLVRCVLQSNARLRSRNPGGD